MIRAERARRGLSQEQAAQELRVGRRTYQRWELGEAAGLPARWVRLLEWLQAGESREEGE